MCGNDLTSMPPAKKIGTGNGLSQHQTGNGLPQHRPEEVSCPDPVPAPGLISSLRKI